jgi:predicted DNA-binding transcriptional regulator AlpA
MSSRFVRFRDLKARGIANSWAQLDNLIKKYGFPPGRMLGPATRVWDLEEEIEPWLAARPVAGPPPRGAAKVAKGRPPKDSRRKAADEAAAVT